MPRALALFTYKIRFFFGPSLRGRFGPLAYLGLILIFLPTGYLSGFGIGMTLRTLDAAGQIGILSAPLAALLSVGLLYSLGGGGNAPPPVWPAGCIRGLRPPHVAGPRDPPSPLPEGPDPQGDGRPPHPLDPPRDRDCTTWLPDPVRGSPDSLDRLWVPRRLGPRGRPAFPREHRGRGGLRRRHPRGMVAPLQFVHLPRAQAHALRGLRPGRPGVPPRDAASGDGGARPGHDPR